MKNMGHNYKITTIAHTLYYKHYIYNWEIIINVCITCNTYVTYMLHDNYMFMFAEVTKKKIKFNFIHI